MTNELVKKELGRDIATREPFAEPVNFTELLDSCKILVASGLLPKEINTPEKAAVVVLTGRELGLRMMASTRSVYVVNGKPSLSAQMMLSLAYGTKELEDIDIQETGDGEKSACTVIVKRKNKKAYSYSFSVDMAKQMGKYANEWLKQPKNMCKQRAISGNLRVTFPDAILGMYTPEEIETVEVETVRNDEWMPKAKVAIADAAPEPQQEAKPSPAPVVEEAAVKTDAEIPLAKDTHKNQLHRLSQEAFEDQGDYYEFLSQKCKNPDKMTYPEYQACLKEIAAIIDKKAKK